MYICVMLYYIIGLSKRQWVRLQLQHNINVYMLYLLKYYAWIYIVLVY